MYHNNRIHTNNPRRFRFASDFCVGCSDVDDSTEMLPYMSTSCEECIHRHIHFGECFLWGTAGGGREGGERGGERRGERGGERGREGREEGRGEGGREGEEERRRIDRERGKGRRIRRRDM